MNSSKPYFFRAMYDWIEDNNLTTHIVVDAGVVGVEVPVDYVSNGEVVLNISSSSVKMFENNNEALSFEARFNGQVTAIYVPIVAIKAVFARENQQGLFFDGRLVGETPPEGSEEATTSKIKKDVNAAPKAVKSAADKGTVAKKSTKKDKDSKKGKSSHLKIIK